MVSFLLLHHCLHRVPRAGWLGPRRVGCYQVVPEELPGGGDGPREELSSMKLTLEMPSSAPAIGSMYSLQESSMRGRVSLSFPGQFLREIVGKCETDCSFASPIVVPDCRFLVFIFNSSSRDSRRTGTACGGGAAPTAPSAKNEISGTTYS